MPLFDSPVKSSNDGAGKGSDGNLSSKATQQQQQQQQTTPAKVGTPVEHHFLAFTVTQYL